jgi:hypothetical protein
MSDEEKDIVDSKSNNKPVVETLTEADKDYIMANWDKVSLMEMAQKISGDPNINGQYKLGRTIREFLKSKNLVAITTKQPKRGEYVLTDPQKEFISQNVDKMKTVEIVSLLFPDERKSMLSAEGRAIYNYIKIIRPAALPKEEKPVEEVEIDVPKSIYKLINIVNKYVSNPRNENARLLDPAKLNSGEEKMMRALLGYMQVPRFEYQANQYKLEVDRELFVSTFVRYLWDKPDTPQEEIDQFISLAAEVVTTSQIDRSIQRLEQEMETTYQETKRVSQGIVDYINAARDKLDKSKERQKKLYDALVGSRSKRLGDKLQNNASILNLIEAWKDEKKRMQMIELAEKQKQGEERDLNALENMDAVMALVCGVSKDEFLN